jgi:hypothetical protein
MATIQALKNFLTAPQSEFKFSELDKLLQDKEKLRVGITFWGERVFSFEGEKGSVSLHAVASRVVSIIRARCLPPNAWPYNHAPDHVAARSVVDRLHNSYRQFDKMIARVNYFTWILSKIRDLRLIRLEIRSDIEFLHDCGFSVGYKIPHWSWFWGHDYLVKWPVDPPLLEPSS